MKNVRQTYTATSTGAGWGQFEIRNAEGRCSGVIASYFAAYAQPPYDDPIAVNRLRAERVTDLLSRHGWGKKLDEFGNPRETAK